MKANFKIFIVIVFLLFPFYFAFAISSANLKIENSTNNPMSGKAASTNLKMDSTIEPIVGLINSANLKIEGGQDLYLGATALSPVGGTGGTPFVCPKSEISVSSNVCEQVYQKNLTLKGTKDSNTYIVYINNDFSAVEFLDAFNWTADLNLAKGENFYEISAKNSCGNFSEKYNLDFVLAKMGDINNDSLVDDYDVSLLANHWQKSWCFADFNLDQIVDDYDLSLMAANWTK